MNIRRLTYRCLCKIFIFIVPTLFGTCMISPVSMAQPTKSNLELFLFSSASYYDINDCNCFREPIGGRRYWNSFGPTLGIQAAFRKNFSMKAGVRRFKHKSLSSFPVNTHYAYILYTSIDHTVNTSPELTIGYLSSGKVRLGLEVGLALFHRRIEKREVTQYYYLTHGSNLPVYTSGVPPDSIRIHSESGDEKWVTLARTLGFNVYVPIRNRLHITAGADLTILWSDWHKDPYDSIWLFWSVDFGIAYKFGK